jgi:tetratricopeptide (TPR) repeat protein
MSRQNPQGGRTTKDEGRRTPPRRQTVDGGRQTAPAKPSGDTARRTLTVQNSKSPIEAHRMVASAGLVLLMLLALFAPLGSTVTDTAPFLAPRIDGANSVITGATSEDLESVIFPYRTVLERSGGNLQSAWPFNISDALNYEPSSREARIAIVGQIFASSSGSLEIRMKDSGLIVNPEPLVFETLALSYQGMLDISKAGNGLAALNLLVTLTARTQEIRYDREREAILGFQQSAIDSPQVWQYTYNWGLANFLTGNYLSAYEAMRSVVNAPETTQFHLIKFWMGLSALRMGEPDEAIRLFNEVIASSPPVGAEENVLASYYEARDLSLEALGDAQWARRDPATAYKTYYDTLLLGKLTFGLYRKWLRLGLEQHAYERMLVDMSVLASSGIDKDMQGRVHHDRARLLGFLGRASEAQGEYAVALSLNGQDDSSLLISYAQSLLAQGDTGGALAQAERALRILSRDPNAGDMASVASPILTTTAALASRQAAQETLSAHLVRAMAWSKRGEAGPIDNLVSNMTAGADAQAGEVGGLLFLYGGYAYEAAAQAAEGDASASLYAKAADTYGKAWARLKGLGSGQPGRAASLAGQARATALSTGKTPADGIAVLKAEGYDPLAISPGVANDADAGDVLYQGALLLESAGQGKEAANAYRVAGVVLNLHDAQNFSGVGRPLWTNNGTFNPSSIALRTGDVLRRTPGSDLSQAVFRYKQAYSLSPALAPAWNNLGVLYSQLGNPASQRYLALGSQASPGYVLGNHNLAAAAYKAGIGDFFTAEEAQGNAIKATGPGSLRWGYELRYDDRSALPAPSGPPVDFWVKVGALAILALLLLHTLVGHDRMTNRMGLVPTRGLIGRLAGMVDARLKSIFPRLLTPGSGTRSAVITSVLIPAVVGTIGLAWAAGHGSWEVALVFVPVAFLLALLAFGANELAQRWAAGRAGVSTLHHVWPTGVLFGLLSIPFGFMYGWQNVTRLTTGEAGKQAGDGSGSIRKARTAEESDLLYEVQAEAAADTASTSAVEAVPAAPAALSTGGSGWFNLSPAARIMFAGTLANLALALVFGAVYWLTGWPSLRLGLFATLLVLAFTSVSEPPADGWTLYRRNAPLWLAVFLFAATLVTLLAVGII